MGDVMTDDVKNSVGWLDCYCDSVLQMVTDGKLQENDIAVKAVAKIRNMIDYVKTKEENPQITWLYPKISCYPKHKDNNNTYTTATRNGFK